MLHNFLCWQILPAQLSDEVELTDPIQDIRLLIMFPSRLQSTFESYPMRAFVLKGCA